MKASTKLQSATMVLVIGLSVASMTAAPEISGDKAVAGSAPPITQVVAEVGKRFASGQRRQPGPNGPGQEFIHALVELQRRNLQSGGRKSAQPLAHCCGIQLAKHVVRRGLASPCRTDGRADGPSGLTFLGHAKDS